MGAADGAFEEADRQDRDRDGDGDAGDVEGGAGEAGAVFGHEHDGGPVPEVDAVGDAAEPDEGAGLERGVVGAGAGALEAEQDGGEREAEEGVAAPEEAAGGGGADPGGGAERSATAARIVRARREKRRTRSGRIARRTARAQPMSIVFRRAGVARTLWEGSASS